VHNRRCSEAQPTAQEHPLLFQSPAWGEIISHSNHYLALAGLWKMGEFLFRRLRFASPPVMHFTPLAGLRAKNKNSTDRLQNKYVVKK
jgi:hypothetical protein